MSYTRPMPQSQRPQLRLIEVHPNGQRQVMIDTSHGITLARLLRDVQTRAGKTISAATAEKLQECITALETAGGGLTDAVELLAGLLEAADGGDDEEEETDTTRSTGLPRREIERARAQGLVIEEIPL